MGSHKKQRKNSTSSSDSSSDANKSSKKQEKRVRNESAKKLLKRKHLSSSSSDSSSSETSSSSSSSDSEEERRRLRKQKKLSVTKKTKKQEATEDTSTDIPLDLMTKSKAMAPMTKEEWEKRQSVVRRVYDESSGRNRLIKGDGEVIEEIVSRDRHKSINQQATKGDGDFFQAQMAGRSKK